MKNIQTIDFIDATAHVGSLKYCIQHTLEALLILREAGAGEHSPRKKLLLDIAVDYMQYAELKAVDLFEDMSKESTRQRARTV